MPRPTAKTAKARTTAARPRAAAPPRPAAAAPRFTGFDRQAPRFFHELAAEMNRDWYQAHKAEYDELWQQPMTALLTAVARQLGPRYRGIGVGAPRLFRIHRDVRFGRDTSPYKTHIGALVPAGNPERPAEGAAACYLQLGL